MKIVSTFRREYSSEILVDEAFKPNSLLLPKKAYFSVVDSKALWFYEQYFRPAPVSLTISMISEADKTMDRVNEITRFLENMRAERSTTLIAVGGGVLLDMAGLAASIYKRGIDWISVPTTLLSQVDASVGGKTAVNSEQAKNIYGTFHLPKQVWITPLASETWSPTHYLEGLAEMYKIFRIFDIASARKLVQNPLNRYFVERSIELKDQVVRIDPWEKNLRAILNYGHTFGHAIEHSTGLRHGLAVALGMRIENLVAEEIGLMSGDTRKRMDADLDHLGFVIPHRLPSFQNLLVYLLQDKKNLDGKIRLALIDGVNDLPMTASDPTRVIEAASLKESYERFCFDEEITVI